MEDTAFESLENALAHHNEWVGQSIKLSVHETPEVDELVEVDLAESIGKSRAYLKHSLSLELADKVRLLIRYLDIWIFGHLDIWIFGYLTLWPVISTFLHLSFCYYCLTSVFQAF
jgi:hypothetical protein